MSRDLYGLAREVTDEVMGAGTYASLNGGNPDPGVQRAIDQGGTMPDVKVTVVLKPEEYRLAHEILTAARQQQEDYINGTGEFGGDGLKARTMRKDPTLDTEKENLSRELEKLVRLNALLERL